MPPFPILMRTKLPQEFLLTKTTSKRAALPSFGLYVSPVRIQFLGVGSRSRMLFRFRNKRGRGVLGAGGVFLEPVGDVFDGRQRAKNVNFFVRSVDVNLQFPFVRAHRTC